MTDPLDTNYADGRPPPVSASWLNEVGARIRNLEEHGGGGGDGSAQIEGFHGIRTSDPPNPPAGEAYQHWYIKVES